jgi:hypothetical protein
LADTFSIFGQDYKTTECPDAAHTFKLPDPVPMYYHFYCTFKSTDADKKANSAALFLWNHAAKIKGFIFFGFKGGFMTNTDEINKIYFTAIPDPHGIPPFVCFVPAVLECHEGTGGPGETRHEQEGPYGSSE